jgi:hypothetical protein
MPDFSYHLRKRSIKGRPRHFHSALDALHLQLNVFGQDACLAISVLQFYRNECEGGSIPVPDIHETAYPRLKNSFSDRELYEFYTPSADDLALASEVTIVVGRISKNAASPSNGAASAPLLPDTLNGLPWSRRLKGLCKAEQYWNK